MGVAATNRGDVVIRGRLNDLIAEERVRADLRRAVDVEEKAHAWRREANLAAADAIERAGMLGGMLSKTDRVYEARKGAINHTMIAWQEARDPFARASAAIDWAAAVYRALDWGRGMFRFPILDSAPATVLRRARKARVGQ